MTSRGSVNSSFSFETIYSLILLWCKNEPVDSLENDICFEKLSEIIP